MATIIQQLRGTANQNNEVTLPRGVISIDETGRNLRLHDAVKAGGHMLSVDRIVDGVNFGIVSGAANAAAFARARAAAGANRPVRLDAGEYNIQQTISPYGTAYKDTRGTALHMGTVADASDHWDPVLSVEKVSKSAQTAERIWDSGCAYYALQKVAGNTYAAVVTAYGHHNGGSNDLVGVHARVRISTNGAGGRGWAIWGYTVSSNTTRAPWHAAEFNGANEGVDPLWGGTAQCVRICMSDLVADGNRMSTALSIGKSTHGGLNGFYTGLDIEADAIIATPNPLDNNEAIKISGPAAGGNIGGIRLRGRMKYALRVDEATLSSLCAVFLGSNQKLGVWETFNGNTYISGVGNFVKSGTHFDIINGGRLYIGGQPSIQTAAPAIANIPAANSNNDLKNDTINAMLATFRHHGLIAA